MDGKYKFIFYSCAIYIEKARSLVVVVFALHRKVYEFEPCATYNVQCLFYFSHFSFSGAHKKNLFIFLSLLRLLQHAILSSYFFINLCSCTHKIRYCDFDFLFLV